MNNIKCQLDVVISNVLLPDADEDDLPVNRFAKLLKSHDVVYSDKPIARDDFDKVTANAYVTITAVSKDDRAVIQDYRWNLTGPLDDLVDELNLDWFETTKTELTWREENDGSPNGEVRLLIATPESHHAHSPLWTALLQRDDFDATDMPTTLGHHLIYHMIVAGGDPVTITAMLKNPTIDPRLWSSASDPYDGYPLFGTIISKSYTTASAMLQLPSVNPNCRVYNYFYSVLGMNPMRTVHPVAKYMITDHNGILPLLAKHPRTDISELCVPDPDVGVSAMKLLLDNDTFDIHNIECFGDDDIIANTSDEYESDDYEDWYEHNDYDSDSQYPRYDPQDPYADPYDSDPYFCN